MGSDFSCDGQKHHEYCSECSEHGQKSREIPTYVKHIKTSNNNMNVLYKCSIGHTFYMRVNLRYFERNILELTNNLAFNFQQKNITLATKYNELESNMKMMSKENDELKNYVQLLIKESNALRIAENNNSLALAVCENKYNDDNENKDGNNKDNENNKTIFGCNNKKWNNFKKK